jgi:hypothetical protein
MGWPAEYWRTRVQAVAVPDDVVVGGDPKLWVLNTHHVFSNTTALQTTCHSHADLPGWKA